MFEAVAFYLFSILTIGMFLVVVFSKNALYAMSALAAGMILISAFFFMLNADFLGVVQIIVYTGAVMALYAFGMMFLDSTKDIKESTRDKNIVYGLGIASIFLTVGIILAPFVSNHLLLDAPLSNPDIFGASNPQAVGVVLFTKYLIPFELAAIMLLVAMIAGIILVGKDMDDSITLKLDDQIEKEEFNTNTKEEK